MRVLGLLLTASCAASLLACGGDDRLELGAQCEFTTDCAEPYVCRLDRCRVECISSRDCPPGAVCLDDNDGRGACRLPPEAECTADADCPTILVCGGGQCRNECTEGSDCPDGLCEELAPDLRTCAEPTGDDAGTPDAGPSDAGPAPTDAGPPAAQTCTTADDCGPDTTCDSIRDEPSICRPTCDLAIGDSDCPGETICMQISDARSRPGVCTHECVIGSTEGCPAGSVCDLFSETRSGDDKVFFSECRTIGDDGMCAGCDVNDARNCQAGFTCTFHEMDRRCVKLCADLGDCSSGEMCDPFADAPAIGGTQWGRCIPTTPTCVTDAGT